MCGRRRYGRGARTPHVHPRSPVMSTDVQSYYTNAAFDKGTYHHLACGIVGKVGTGESAPSLTAGR